MAADLVAARYAQALFELAREQDELERTLEQLDLIRRALTENRDARQLFLNPDVEPQDKVQVLDRALKGSWSKLARHFIHMVVSAGRGERLQEIVEAFAALVDDAAKRIRVTARTARPLSPALQSRLRKALEQREAKQVLLTAELDPQLLGGLQVVLGHRVIDGSVRRQLLELRAQLASARVS